MQSARYWNAGLDFQPAQWVGMTAARTSYCFATVNNVGAYASIGPLNFHGNAYESGQHSGESVGAAARVDFLDLRVDRFSGGRATTTGMVGERFGHHWTVDEFISESAGRYSADLGGGYSSNRLSFSAGQSVYWMPLLGRFQRALAVTISFHLPHDSAVTLANNVDPTGKLRFTAYGGSYLYGNLSNDSASARLCAADSSSRESCWINPACRFKARRYPWAARLCTPTAPECGSCE